MMMMMMTKTIMTFRWRWPPVSFMFSLEHLAIMILLIMLKTIMLIMISSVFRYDDDNYWSTSQSSIAGNSQQMNRPEGATLKRVMIIMMMRMLTMLNMMMMKIMLMKMMLIKWMFTDIIYDDCRVVLAVHQDFLNSKSVLQITKGYNIFFALCNTGSVFFFTGTPLKI